MPSTVTMSGPVYEQLVAVYEALKGLEASSDTDVAAQLDAMKSLLVTVDRDNSLTRHRLWVRWHDLSARPVDYPNYPPEERGYLWSYTAFTEDFVVAFVVAQTTSYANIFVTPDPSGVVGWLDIDTYFA